MEKSLEKRLSTKQLKAIKMLMDIDNPLTKREIASKLHISEQALYKWLKDPAFLKALNEYSEEWMRNSLHVVNKKLMELIKKGNIQAIRIYYEKVQELQQMGVLKLVVNLGGIDDGSSED